MFLWIISLPLEVLLWELRMVFTRYAGWNVEWDRQTGRWKIGGQRPRDDWF